MPTNVEREHLRYTEAHNRFPGARIGRAGYDAFALPQNELLWRSATQGMNDDHFWVGTKLTACHYAVSYDVGIQGFRTRRQLQLFIMSENNLRSLLNTALPTTNFSVRHVTGLGLDIGNQYVRRAAAQLFRKRRCAALMEVHPQNYIYNVNVNANVYAHKRLARQLALSLKDKGFDGWIYPQTLHPQVMGNTLFEDLLDAEIMLWSASSRNLIGLEVQGTPDDAVSTIVNDLP